MTTTARRWFPFGCCCELSGTPYLCCCDGSTTCPFPATLKVRIAGIGNNSCVDCTAINTTFTLNYISGGSGICETLGFIEYRYDIPATKPCAGPGASIDAIRLRFVCSQPGGLGNPIVFTILLEILFTFAFTARSITFGTAWECGAQTLDCTFAYVLATAGSANPLCDWSASATATLSR